MISNNNLYNIINSTNNHDAYIYFYYLMISNNNLYICINTNCLKYILNILSTV